MSPDHGVGVLRLDENATVAGRKPANDPIHARLDRIAIGQPLELVPLADGWGLRVPGESLVLGRLAGQYSLPTTGRIEAIVGRRRDQPHPEFASRLACKHWYVLLPTLTWCEGVPDDVPA
mgnify:CR=1 FL=1